MKNLFSPILQRLLDDPARYLAEIREDSETFANDIAEEVSNLDPKPGAILTLASVAMYVFDARGNVLAKMCPVEWPERLTPADVLDQFPKKGASQQILFLRFPQGDTARAVCLDAVTALLVNLPLAIREALTQGSDRRLLMCTNMAVTAGALDASAASFGLNGLQQRVVCAVVQSGSGRTAAENLNLSYATVREALALAARNVAAQNLPALVRRIMEGSFGIMPNHFGNAEELAKWLPLSERQCQICELISEGINRQATAGAMRLSMPVIKKELAQIYTMLDVDSAAGLARIWSETQALRFLARATDGPMGFYDPSIEPTRYLLRSNDQQVIAWSDYGPASGRPVLIVHSNWTCRSVPRMMVVRLQAAGWRPIAIDRPGFGKTHPGSLSVSNPFEQAVSDTVAILDRLKIAKAAVITRRAGQFTTVLKHGLGERIGPIILTSPSSPTSKRGRRRGVVGVIKEAFFRSPQMIGTYFRIITPQLSLKRMEKLTRDICQGSPPDEKLCDDPQFIFDRFRAIRPLSTGNLEGAVIEEMQISQNLFQLKPLTSGSVLIVHGLHDNHYSLQETIDYWSDKWPNAEIMPVEDGGQFLTSSHSELLVSLLGQLDTRITTNVA